VLTRLRVLAVADLAATPRAIEDGRVWLLATSAFVADRPQVPSILGFVIVGLAALVGAGPRVLWAAAAAGHVVATLVVYAALDLAAYSVTQPDYGTSAVIAAWIGVVAYHVYRRRSGAAAAAICIVAGLVGLLLRPNLDVLDTEHVVALAFGAATAAWLPGRAPVRANVLLVRRLLARRDLLLRGGLLRGGLLRLGARRSG
jgi:hypothetical protein